MLDWIYSSATIYLKRKNDLYRKENLNTGSLRAYSRKGGYGTWKQDEEVRRRLQSSIA